MYKITSAFLSRVVLCDLFDSLTCECVALVVPSLFPPFRVICKSFHVVKYVTLITIT